MRIELKDWTLTIIPHKEYCAYDTAPDNIPADAGVTIPAIVPGNFELDMVRAGLLEDPYWGSNITKLRELEDRHLIYRTTFDKPVLEEGELPVLRFEGIDTYADIYINGIPHEYTDNMFLTYEIPISRPVQRHLKEKGNELTVHICPTMIQAQETILPPSAGMFPFGYASLYTRKAPSSFGWDILCRAVSGVSGGLCTLKPSRPPPSARPSSTPAWSSLPPRTIPAATPS